MPNVKIIPDTYPYVVKVLKKSNELTDMAPTLRKQKDLIEAKFKLIQSKEKSEIDLLVAKIDDWLEIYNNYKLNKAIANKVRIIASTYVKGLKSSTEAPELRTNVGQILL